MATSSRAQQKTFHVGVLGATGTVGQRFITLLSVHPFLRIHTLGASERSAGKAYLKATKWKQSTPCHDSVRALPIVSCDPANFSGCDIIFSGLDADFAGPIETAFRAAGFKVFSNAKNYRRDPLVPLLVPTANPNHLGLVAAQQTFDAAASSSSGGSGSGSGGFIVTNSNCSTAGIVVPLAALQIAYPGLVRDVEVVTMQAVSGGGYPGVPSLDILDNVVPFIPGEEEKIEWETCKILGSLQSSSSSSSDGGSPRYGGGIVHADYDVSASCNRVAVIDGHLACVTLKFDTDAFGGGGGGGVLPTVDDVVRTLRDFRPLEKSAALPSCPRRAIHVLEDEDRPQPRLDRDLEGGYAVSVGRIRPVVRRRRGGRGGGGGGDGKDEGRETVGVKFVSLVHNTVLGAAGMGILNAELAIQQGFIRHALDGSKGNL